MISIFKQIQGWVKLKGDTDGTKIGNIGDKLKTTSIYTPGNTSGDFFMEVSKGNVSGHSVENKFGTNPNSSTTREDVWDAGGVYVFPSAAERVNVSSSSVKDTLTGVGARSITLFGLDSNYNAISESFDLNGTTDVLSTNSYLRMYRMYITECGPDLFNDGDITATQETSGLLVAQISEGNNQTAMTMYTIPAGKTGYIIDFSFSAPRNNEAEFKGFIRVLGGCFQLKFNTVITESFNQSINRLTSPIPEKSDLRIFSELDVAIGITSVNYDILLVDNVI
jgi:hypothetical protein